MVDVRVYEVSGRMVRSLVSEPLKAGSHKVMWDGRDDKGRTVASGTYYYSMSIDGVQVATNKAVLLK